MTQIDEIQLIRGVFTPEDAREILVTIISDKINFHQKRSFSLLERLNKKDEESMQRIDELKESRGRVIRIIEKAIENDQKLRIDSVISITAEEHAG